ncbi:MAG: hypothetical protein ABMA64_30740, partial [Myxococcota bacterium]
ATDRRAAAAAAATSRVASPAPTGNDDDLAKMISFNGSVNDITAEEIDSMIKFGPPPSDSAPVPEPVVRSAAPPKPARDLEDEPERPVRSENVSGIRDLDKGSPKPTRTKPSSGDLGHIVQITGRGGVTKYYKFNFITGGGELGVAVAKGLHLVAGAEVYGVERVLPPELQLDTGIYSQWNFIFPLNVGAIYKIPVGPAQPYVGADTIFVQYYKDALGADWAAGARLRAGVDLMVVRNFGFNLNVAAGAWSGANWGLIEQGVGKSGFLPQVSAGTVFAF